MAGRGRAGDQAQPLPDPADEELNARRARPGRQADLLAAVNERLAGRSRPTFEYGLDLLIAGLRARYVGVSDGETAVGMGSP